MPTASRVMIALLAFVLLAVGGCKKTAENQSAAWKSGVAEVTALMAKYPGFKPALQSRLDEAQKIWDAASSLSDEAQVEKMSEANVALDKGFVGELDAVQKKMDELRKKRVEAAAQVGESSELGAKVAVEDAQKALDRAEATLEKGATDDASAAAVLSKIQGDLKTASAALDKVLAVDKKKSDDKTAKEDAKTEADAKAKADAEAKVAPWKCEFCASENPHDAGKCASCGAPRAAAK